jgi:hypothetical protein
MKHRRHQADRALKRRLCTGGWLGFRVAGGRVPLPCPLTRCPGPATPSSSGRFKLLPTIRCLRFAKPRRTGGGRKVTNIRRAHAAKPPSGRGRRGLLTSVPGTPVGFDRGLNGPPGGDRDRDETRRDVTQREGHEGGSTHLPSDHREPPQRRRDPGWVLGGLSRI